MVASPKGRCAGCGKIGSVREVERHTTGCEQFAQLYSQDPARALSPAEEFARYQREDRNEEVLEVRRQEELDAKKQRYQADAENKLDLARARWGLRGQPPLRSGSASPVDPETVSGAVLSSVRPGLPANLAEAAERAGQRYSQPS